MVDMIKVMLVDDNDTTRNGTMSLLEFEDNIEIVGFAENGQVAIERARELSPDVILMDINMPVMNGIEATTHIGREMPRIQVIVVSVQDDAHYLKEAFRAGAVDFVAKPITSDELVEAIGRAYSKIPPPESLTPAPQPMAQQQVQYQGGDQQLSYKPSYDGKVISVLGLKGGVGKTTVAVSLAVGLARAGKKTLLMDTSLLFGDVSVFLNTQGQLSIINLARMAIDADQLDEDATSGVILEHESGLNLIIAPSKLSESEPVSQGAMINLIEYIKKDYEYVILDTATTFDGVLAAAIETADNIIVMTEPNMPALKDARHLFSELRETEYLADDTILVLNRVDKFSNISADQISKFLKHQVAIQIPTDMSSTQAVNEGIPLISHDAKRSPAVRPLRGLVQLVRERFEAADIEPVQQQEKRGSGLFGRRN